MSTPVTSGVPLPKLVRHTVGRLVELLKDADPDAARWVAAVRDGRPSVPSVVVVGETNRGKSSLVNALLSAENLSPVDAHVATANYLVFAHGEDWAAQACYPGQVQPVSFPVEQLHRWVTASGELPEGQLPPRFVRVQAPIPLLSRLTVIDTPGVGGLDSMHGELAAEAAANATALLFVVDASAPLTSGELTFLAQAGERVETVLFALTKTDQYRGWRQVLEANRALLAEHAPRFADAVFHPVSARMFGLAKGAPTPETGALLREQSGIAPLQTGLQELVAAHAAMLAEANTLRAAATALAGQAVALAAEQRALSTGEAEAESLRARKDELVALRRSATRGWQVKLRGETQRARLESSHEVARQMRDVQSWFRRAIDAANRDGLQRLPQELDAALQLVSGRLSQALATRLDVLAQAVLAELFAPDELEVIRAQFARAGAPPVLLRSPDRRPPNAEDKLLVFMGVSGGLGLGKAAALPLAGLGIAASSALVLPVTIVLGLGAGWWLARTRKQSADKTYLKQWLTEVVADARSTMEQLVSEQLIEAEQQLSLAMDEALGKRIGAIEDELREVDKALRMDTAERNRQLQVVGKRLAEVKAGRAQAEMLLGRIREQRNNAAGRDQPEAR
ncbi:MULTISPECIES: dynamin family protein [unclassified Crossiella]|uniref:dynamin family protein n=1 Tax=unclassified Crossiella TaxID=2620835 RepID=UPI002000059C|nr:MULTISPECIES: dynamin family protein [unclassified Crossiella]MCK2236324.1 dynamin family protein [Crossiella sp. S99.2]MCK2249991.1 dynamin family protein [Crossiella sp. S99.1]